jgi:hypothetical protein
MPELYIIGTPHSNFTWTTPVVCVEKGTRYSLDQRRSHTPEVESISPFSLIPVSSTANLNCSSRGQSARTSTLRSQARRYFAYMKSFTRHLCRHHR